MNFMEFYLEVLEQYDIEEIENFLNLEKVLINKLQIIV